MKKANRKQAFAIGISGLLPLVCVSMCYWGTGLETSVRICYLILAVICVLLMLFVLNGEIPIFHLRMRGGRIDLIPRELGSPKRRRVPIVSNIVPQNDDKGVSDEKVKDTIEQFYKILETGEDGVEKYVEAVKFLNGNLPLVKKSWRLTANYGRCSLFTGEFKKARDIADTLLDRFSTNPKAVASAYEIMAIVAESRMPVVNGKLKEEVLEQRMLFVKKGLAADPCRLALLVEGFDIAVEQGRAETAELYLLRAITVDKEGAKAHLSRSPMLARAVELSPELSRHLNALGLNPNHVSPERNGRRKNER